MPSRSTWTIKALSVDQGWGGGPDVRVDDGRIEVCILRARTLLDYLSVALNVVRGRHRDERNIQYLTARRTVAIHTEPSHPGPGRR